MTPLRQRMLEDLQIRNYSPSTVRCYVRSVADFAKHFKRSPDQLGSEEIRSWQLYLLRDKGVKISSYIQSVCGLRFFYTNTLNRKVEIERIPLPRYEKKLPVILSKEEVKAAPIIGFVVRWRLVHVCAIPRSCRSRGYRWHGGCRHQG